MTEEKSKLKSFCRSCGGNRNHLVLAEVTNSWSECDTPVSGSDSWILAECGGCETVSFIHRHWFSEDVVETDEGPAPISHHDVYPPAPLRKMPEWAGTLLLDLPPDCFWISGLHKDIYAALGLKAYSLGAMGIRAIVDYVVTSKAGQLSGTFKDKAEKLREQGLITDVQVDILVAAFDAGSAAAHRGFEPNEKDVFTLLDIAEHLLDQIYVVPGERIVHARAAAELKARTLQRKP